MRKNMRMSEREWSKNMWERLMSLIDGQGQAIASAIKSISFNGSVVPPSAAGRVTLEETDPTVPEWAKNATKPTYTASEVGALPSSTVVPTKTSDLTNDGNGTSRFATLNDIPATSAPDVSHATGVLGIDHGGTGAYAALNARENLGVAPFLSITSAEVTRVYELKILLSQTTPNYHRGINVYTDSDVTYLFTGGKCSGGFTGVMMFDHSTADSGGSMRFTYHFFGMLDYAGAPNYAEFVYGKFTDTGNDSVDAVVYKATATQVT